MRAICIRIGVASLVSAIILFAWGFVFWGLLANSIAPFKALTGDSEREVIEALQKNLPESGAYLYPWPDADAADPEQEMKAFEQKHADGPLVTIIYSQAGYPTSEMAAVMVWGFLHMLVSAVVVAILLAMAGPMCCYGMRVLFVVVLGVFASLWIHIQDLIWFHYPLDFVLFHSTYHVVAWVLAGFVIAAIVRTGKKDADPAKT